MTQLPWWDPSCLATAMARHFGEEGLVWLDGDGSQLGQRALLAAAPQKQLRCCGLPGQPGSADPFEALEEIQQNRNGIWFIGCDWRRYWTVRGNCNRLLCVQGRQSCEPQDIF